MNRTLRLLHLLIAIALIAGLATPLLTAGATLPQLEAASRLVLRPALMGIIVSGLLLLALRPALFEQRWLWAKLLSMMLLAPAVWLADPHASGGPGGWAALALAAVALALGLWRPRLGG